MTVVNFERAVEEASAPHERELERLRRAHEESRRLERGRAVVLHGPRGAGSDALLTEWKRELHRRREHLFEGDCLPGAAVYAPLAEIVSRWVRAIDDLGLMTEALQVSYQRVGRALGIPRLTVLDPAAELGSETAGPIPFYEALGELLSELSMTLPGVVVLRDLHRADSATRAAVTFLLQHVVTDSVGSFAPAGLRSVPFAGLLVVSVASESPVAAGLRRSLAEREGLTFINLQGVTEEAVRRFLSRPEVVRRFVDSSGGVADNLEALLESIPRKVEDLFLRRCEQLAPAELEALGALAVFGKPVAPDLLLRVLGDDTHGGLISGLFEKRILSRRVHRGQLLVDVPTEDNRDVVYARLSPVMRERLHGRIAALLEERARYGEPADLAELARHYLASAETEKAVHFALSAAERLHISYAYEQAIDLLERALPKVELPVVRRQVLDRLIDLHACQSEHRRALFYCGRLKKELAARARGPLYRRVAEMLLELGDYRMALRALERARSLVDAGDYTDSERLDERTRLAAIAAEAYYGRGQYERVLAVCREALSALVGVPSPSLQRQVLRLTNTVGKVNLFKEDYVQATHSFTENLRRAEAHKWVQEALRARFNLGTVALQRRRYDEAEEAFQTCLSQGVAGQNPVIRAFCLMNLGVVYHKTHRYDEALDAYLHGLATFKKSGNDLQFAVVAMNLGALYQTIGDTERAKALIETSLEVTRARDIKFYQGWGSYVRGGIALDDGAHAEAERHLERAFAIMTELGSASWVDRIRVRQARLAFERGEGAACEALVGAIRHDDAQSRDALETEAEGLLWLGRARSRAASTVEARREALACFTRAHELFVSLGHEERLWFVELALAEHLLASGQEDVAQRHLADAKTRLEALAGRVPKALREEFAASPARRRVYALLDEASQARAPARRPVAPRALRLPDGGRFAAWRQRYSRIIGENPRLLQLCRMIDKVADSDSTILIQGQSGTGKELIAEAIHGNSARRDGPFVKVNCAAFVETLLLSELFGHEKGAFTGAMSRKKGRFELAHGGTIFLDEIGDISANTQVALLRVLQERTFERVGGGEPIEIDVRVIVATNRNLEEMVKREEFRLDLYYRLKGVIMELPPLRERRDDIPRLLEHFLGKYQARPEAQRFSRDALDFLARYSWPGNVRELENFTRSITLFVDDAVIDLAHILQFEEFFADGEVIDALPEGFFEALEAARQAASQAALEEAAPALPARAVPVELVVDAAPLEPPPLDEDTAADPAQAMMAWAQREGVGLPELRRRLELECIRRALAETGGNITKAASLLDMKRPRLSQIINGTPELAHLKAELVSNE
jgi:transcriptional regulator with GAF, ATPase, and Fis domain